MNDELDTKLFVKLDSNENTLNVFQFDKSQQINKDDKNKKINDNQKTNVEQEQYAE